MKYTLAWRDLFLDALMNSFLIGRSAFYIVIDYLYSYLKLWSYNEMEVAAIL